jgi:hypothetical protein
MVNLKSLCLLWTDLAKNHRYAELHEERDLKTFDDRVSAEGLSFLTTTLPKIGRALDNYHSTAEWKCPDSFRSKIYWYSTVRGKFFPLGDPKDDEVMQLLIAEPDDDVAILHIPVFLGKAIKLALEGDSLAVDYVRQLSYIFYKLEVQYEPALVAEFLESFKRTDRELELVIEDVPVYLLVGPKDSLASSIRMHLNCMARLVRRVL